jgi:DNA-binding transcriptional LysR family regulator
VLAEYARRYPKVTIDLEDALSEEGIRAVQKGTAELAVIGDNVPYEGLETFVCNVDRLVLLVPSDHPLGTQSIVPVEKVFGFDLVTLARSASLTRLVMAAGESVGRTPRIRVQVRSFDSMCRMVASRIGIAILPRAAATLYAQALELKMVGLDGIAMDRLLLLAMRQRSDLSSAAAALVEMLEQGTAEGRSARRAAGRRE